MNILFLDSVHEILQNKLVEAGYNCVDGANLSIDELKTELARIQGIIIRARFTLDETILKHATHLKFIARSGAGMENIDENYCAQKGIILFNAPEGNRNAVGEHALGMLLTLMNKIHTANRDVKNGLWEREKNRGIELDGKTVGIIGFGNNGSAFAKKLKGFDVHILAYDKYKTGFSTNQISETKLEEIFLQADVLSFHIPQNEETIYFADELFFQSFQKPIFLLNLSRGKIVNSKALLNAINSGSVLGAGLDVLEFEKSSFENMFDNNMSLEFKELIESEKVLLTPHVGGWTNESYINLSDVLATKILNHFGRMN